MKTLIQYRAKSALLDHLRASHDVDPEVITGAKTKLGADLADALNGEVGQELRRSLQAEKERLERRQFRRGDVVLFRTDTGVEARATVVSADPGGVVVNYAGRPSYSVDSDDCTGAELDSIRRLFEAAASLPD